MLLVCLWAAGDSVQNRHINVQDINWCENDRDGMVLDDLSDP